MPKIAEYINTVEGVRPSETGIEAFAAAGRRAGAFYNQVADTKGNVGATFGRNLDSAINDAGRVAVDYADHQLISRGAAALTAKTAALTDEWDKRVKTAAASDRADDPNVAKDFRDQVLEPELEKFGQTFWTEKSRDWAQQRIAALRQHMTEKTTADMGRLAGDAIKTRMTQMVNNASNVAMMDPGFNTIDYQLGVVESSLRAMVGTSPNLKGADAALVTSQLMERARESIVRSGAQGMIQSSSDPERTAREVAKKYPDYVSGPTLKGLERDATQQLRYMHAEQRANEAEARRKATDAFHQEATQVELSTTRTNATTGVVEPFSPPGLRETLTRLGNMPNADSGRMTALVHRAEQVGSAMDETSQRNLANASRVTQAEVVDASLRGEPKTPQDLNKLYVDHKLTWDAKEQLMRNYYADKSATGEPIAARRTEYLRSREGLLDPARMIAGLKSSEGSIALDKAGQALRKAEEDLRKAGKDPQSLYEYDAKGVSPADAIIAGFNVPLSALPGNLQRQMGITEGAPKPIPEVPPGTPIPDAIKLYGKGATVRVKGKLVVLPNE